MARNYASLFHEYLKEMGCLSDAEFGRLCRALLEYSANGTPITLNGNERFFAERVMAQEARMIERYEATVEQRREAGKRSAEQRALTSVDSRSTNGNEINKFKSKVKVKDNISVLKEQRSRTREKKAAGKEWMRDYE